MVRKNLTDQFFVPLCGTPFTQEERKYSVLHELFVPPAAACLKDWRG